MAHTRSAPGISLLVARVGSASVRVSVLEGAERGMVIRATRMTGLVPPRSARGCGTEPMNSWLLHSLPHMHTHQTSVCHGFGMIYGIKKEPLHLASLTGNGDK